MKTKRFISILFVLACSLQLYAKDCPVSGLSKSGTPPPAKNQALNTEKNRSTAPDDANIDQSVTINKMLASGDDPKAFDETKGASITGYLFKAKKEAGESCNCYAADDAHHDIHVFIAPNKSVTSIGECAVVEITPWVKINHPDWTLDYLNSIMNHKVRITGWLMYDFEHTNVSAATNPDLANPQRGTVWEVHPITNIEDLEADGSDASEGEEITPTSGPVNRQQSTPPPGGGTNQTKPPCQILCIILLGAVLGVTGQLIRVAIGLKKLNDTSNNKEDYDNSFDMKKLLLSVLYAVIIGVVCGVLMVVQDIDTAVIWNKATIIAIIAAGYSGVDFIEAFVGKNLPSSSKQNPTGSPVANPMPGIAPPAKITTGTPSPGGITQ